MLSKYFQLAIKLLSCHHFDFFFVFSRTLQFHELVQWQDSFAKDSNIYSNWNNESNRMHFDVVPSLGNV